jgi:hypothetical protein
MKAAEREQIIHRIISGCIRCHLYDYSLTLLLKSPTRLQRYIAEEIYAETLMRAELEGCYTQEQYISILKEKDIWNDTKEDKLQGFAKQIENLKFTLYNSVFKSRQRDAARKALKIIREEQIQLNIQLYEYEYLTAIGVASMAKARYIITSSLYRLDGTKLFNENEPWSVPNNLIEAVALIINKNKLTEAQIREISRTDPWRTIWMGKKAESSVFGVPAVDLTEEQRLLSIWSGVYDNVYEHPESPSEEVINEDDMLDGWMIHQKRKRESEKAGQDGDSLIQNEKIRNADEILIPVDTAEDARKVNALNDAHASMVKRKREALIKNKGSIDETHMPDSQLKIRQEMNRQFMQHAKG